MTARRAGHQHLAGHAGILTNLGGLDPVPQLGGRLRGHALGRKTGDVLPILPEVRRPKISAYYTPEMLQERIAQCPLDAELGIMIWDMG